MWFLLCINFFITIIYTIDLWYYRAFGTYASAQILKETANLDNLEGSIFSMIHVADILLYLDFAYLLYKALRKKDYSKEAKRNVVAFICFLIIPVLLIQLVHYKEDIIDKGRKGIYLFHISWTPNQTISNLSPIGYHIYDAYEWRKESQPYILDKKEKNEINEWYQQKKENLPDNNLKGLFKGKNLIILQVESLENFVIDQKICEQEITPNLNRLLKNSIYFKNYYEQVHQGISSDADLMTNTSVYPVRRGSTFFRYPHNTYNSLPKMFESTGYSTIAIHPDKGAYWNWMDALKSIGFQKCVDAASFKSSELIGLGISDSSYLKQVEPMIKARKQPFYTFMVTLSSHSPFDIAKKFRYLSLDKKLDKTKLGGYFQSIHYTDRQIGTFIDNLEKDGLLDNTVLAIYGDHCGIHKFYQSELDNMKDVDKKWTKNDKRIPLIIYSKGFEAKSIDTIGGEIDLLPTISYLMGIDQKDYENTAMGRNLLKTGKNFAVLDTGTCINVNLSKGEQDNAIKGLYMADKMISSNYFSRR